MKLPSPSFIAYIVHFMLVLGIIDAAQASYFWPLVQITSIFGIIIIAIVSPRFNDFYFGIFSKHGVGTFVDYLAILYKIYLLGNFPKNNTFFKENVALLLLYSSVAIWVSKKIIT